MNRYQAKTIADMLLFMVVATGLFAMVVCWPAARADKDRLVQKQNVNNVSTFNFHDEVKFMRYLHASDIMR